MNNIPTAIIIAGLLVILAAFIPTLSFLGQQVDEDIRNWLIRRRSARRLG